MKLAVCCIQGIAFITVDRCTEGCDVDFYGTCNDAAKDKENAVATPDFVILDLKENGAVYTPKEPEETLVDFVVAFR